MALVADTKFVEKFNLDNAIQFISYMNNVHRMYTVGLILSKEILESHLQRQRN